MRYICFECYNFKEYMQQQKFSSPKLSKKGNNMSSPTLPKDKLYLPSRYALDPTKKDSNMLTLLNSIQLNAREQPRLKLSSPLNTAGKDRPKIEGIKKKESVQFKPRPMKREQSDMQNFKQIFLDPRQQVLSQIQEKSKSEQIVMAKQVCKDYQRLLQFQKGGQSLSPGKQKQEPLQQSDLGRHYQEAIQLLQRPPADQVSQSFYEEQIRVEPPETPNSSVASTISPGAGYAPSVPLLPSRKGTLGELLMRAKAGMTTQDIQKEAHLAFYLGMVYEEKRSHHSAVRFYKRYLGFAKAMQDKIGMALGANRVAVNLYYEGQAAKSISFHHQNLKLSDNQNCFAAYYNLGVCHRVLRQFQQAISCLQTALEWSRQRGEAESECITLGQLAVSYKSMQLYQKALEQFDKSADICRRLKKTPLLAQNLQQMLLIMSNYNLSSSEKLVQIATEAYECAKILQSKTATQQHACNIGIIKGFDQFIQQIQGLELVEQVEQFQLPAQEMLGGEREQRLEDENILVDYDKVSDKVKEM